MARAILGVFEEYQAARTKFVQQVADLALRPQNIEALQNAGVMPLLRPLLADNVPSIQQSAALGLGRLASYSESLAEAVVTNDVLPQLVASLSDQNRYYKKAACFVMQRVAKHSPELAGHVLECGAVDALVDCLGEFDAAVKENAACALGFLSRHTPEQAQCLVDAGAVPALVLCVQEPEISLKRVAASVLTEISKHSAELAQAVVDSGAVTHLAPLVQHPDDGLKRKACAALAQIAKHSVDLAENVVEAEVLEHFFVLLKCRDMLVRKNAATAIREIAKHTPELARIVVNGGGHAAIIDYIDPMPPQVTTSCGGGVTPSYNEAGTTLMSGGGQQRVPGHIRLPGIMALGYIAAFSETLALAILTNNAIPSLKDALMNDSEDYIRAAAAWSLGQLGRHSPDHAKAIAQADVLSKLIQVYADENSSEDLKTKCKNALKGTLQKCTALNALESLLYDTPDKILQYIVQQFAKVLPNDATLRKSFVMSGGLQRVQQLAAEDKDGGSKFANSVTAITSCYPPEIVQYYSPGYSETLLKMLDQSELQS